MKEQIMPVNKIRYKLAEISPLFDNRHILTVATFGVSLILLIMLFIGIKLLVALCVSGFFLILWIFFAFKRSSRFYQYQIYLNINSSIRGDILEVGIIGFDKNEYMTVLSVSYSRLLFDLNPELTYEYIVSKFSVIFLEELNLTLFTELQFETYDQANIIRHHVFNQLKTYILQNISYLRTSNRFELVDKVEIKKYSRLFGIFRR